MKTRKIDVVWSVSLIVLGLAVLMQFGLRIAGVALPDAAVRWFGAVYLLALPVLSFTTVRKLYGKAAKEEGGRQNGDQ